MSDAPPPADPPNDDERAKSRSAEATSTESKKKRSPIEKFLVWGLILALAGLAGYEAMTSSAFDNSIAAVDDTIRGELEKFKRMEEEGATAQEIESAMSEGIVIKLSDVEKLMTGSPKKTVIDGKEGPSVAVYEWSTPLKTYGGLRIRFDKGSDNIQSHSDYVGASDE